MTTSSIREQIIDYHVKELKKLNSISTVTRVLPTFEEVLNFAVTQFPLAAIVTGLPVPNEKLSQRDRSVVDVIISDLEIDTYVYVSDNETPDEKLSNIADDVWAKLYSLTTYNSLAFGTILNFTGRPEYVRPILAFKITSTVTYKHSTGGI